MKKTLGWSLVFLVPAIVIPLIAAAWLVATESGLHWLISYGARHVPGELHVERVNGRLIGPAAFDGLRYRFEGTTVEAGHIKYDLAARALLRSTLHILQLNIEDVAITQSPSLDNKAGVKPGTLPDLRLPLALELDELTIHNLNMASGTNQPLNFSRIRLAAHTRFDKLRIDQFEVNTDQFTGTLQGNIDPYDHYRHDLVLAWRVSLPGLPAVSGTGSISGDTTKTRIVQHVSGPVQGDIELTLRSIQADFSWFAHVHTPSINAQQINAAWPMLRGSVDLNASGTTTSFESQGEFAFAYDRWNRVNARFSLTHDSDGVYRIAALDLTAEDLPTQVSATGTWQPGQGFGQLNAALTWHQLVWPFAGPAVITSPTGIMQVSGNADDYRFRSAGDVNWKGIATSQFTLSGSGDKEHIVIPELHVAALDGDMTGETELAWQPNLRWRAHLSGANLNPGQINAEWPGALRFNIDSNGRLTDKGVNAAVDVANLSGTLRGRPLEFVSLLTLDNKTVGIKQASLKSGQSVIRIHGHINDRVDIDWVVDSPNLLDIHPDAKGILNAHGTIKGVRNAPLLTISLEGSGIGYGDYSAGHIQGATSLRLNEWSAQQLNITASTLQLHGFGIDMLHIEGTGSTDTQHIVAIVTTPEVSVVVENRIQASNGQWNITVPRADIISNTGGNWKLDTPSIITITTDELNLKETCWSQEDKTGTACFRLEKNGFIWNTNVSIDQLPLQPFALLVSQPLAWEGTAGIKLDAQYLPDTGLSGRVAVYFEPGSITYPLPDGEQGVWRYLRSDLTANLDAEGLSTRINIPTAVGGLVNAQIRLPAFNPLAGNYDQQAVDGRVEGRLGNLAIFDVLIPEIQNTKGEFNVNANLSGTLGTTNVDGVVAIRDGSFRVPRLGLDVTELSIDGNSVARNRLEYRLSARSGDGTVLATGTTRLDPGGGWPTELHISGDNVEVSRIPEARIAISPDLTITIASREIHVDGQVTVPYARLQPKDLSSTAKVSEDVVIVGEKPSAVEEKWKIFTNIRVILGDRVSLYGFGFEGRVAGNLLLTDRPGEVTTASGELSVPEGRYQAYGQRLEVELGKVLFTGGPVSNPGLDLRAVRKVENVTAGVRIRGTLRNPQLELFSIPAMGETDILSYLVLGRPIDAQSGEDAKVVAQAALLLSLKGGDLLARSLTDRFGLDEMRIETSNTGEQASLVVGRYLSPKLYVSYGVGLIDSVNTFNVRYRLSEHWQLRAESGLHQSADAIYTIER